MNVLTKRHYIGFVYTNNARENFATKVSDIRTHVGEPLVWAADKIVYACEVDGQINYVLTKH